MTAGQDTPQQPMWREEDEGKEEEKKEEAKEEEQKEDKEKSRR